ncbi:signal peptidase II [Candidatus Gracilibacteria bacterium]|nr:signal peptidase II [Candidatus Gracilibacteria bacterium]
MRRLNILLVAGIMLIAFFDFFTKFLAQSSLTPAQPIKILPFLKLELTQNSSLAFGIPFPRGLIILLSVAAIIFLGNLFVKNVKKESKIGIVAFALLLGGAFGNLMERILFGKVTDFISLSIIPNFNFADTALTIGVALLIIFHHRVFEKI